MDGWKDTLAWGIAIALIAIGYSWYDATKQAEHTKCVQMVKDKPADEIYKVCGRAS